MLFWLKEVFSKNLDTKYFEFVGYMIFMAAAQLCCCTTATDDLQMNKPG